MAKNKPLWRAVSHGGNVFLVSPHGKAFPYSSLKDANEEAALLNGALEVELLAKDGKL